MEIFKTIVVIVGYLCTAINIVLIIMSLVMIIDLVRTSIRKKKAPKQRTVYFSKIISNSLTDEEAMRLLYNGIKENCKPYILVKKTRYDDWSNEWYAELTAVEPKEENNGRHS